VLTQTNGGTNHASLTLPAPVPRIGDTSTLVFNPGPTTATAQAHAQFLARVRVDDAESLLTGGGFDSTTNRTPIPYSSPIVVLP